MFEPFQKVAGNLAAFHLSIFGKIIKMWQQVTQSRDEDNSTFLVYWPWGALYRTKVASESLRARARHTILFQWHRAQVLAYARSFGTFKYGYFANDSQLNNLSQGPTVELDCSSFR